MDDVVGHDFPSRESVVRGLFHQRDLAHPDLTPRLAAPPRDSPKRGSCKYLRIPVIRLETQQLPARLQHPVEDSQSFRTHFMTEDACPDDVVEAFRRELA